MKKNNEVVELAKEDDRKWFEGHPGESVRHRDAFHGEFKIKNFPIPPGATSSLQVEVTQISRGVRIRRPWVAIEFSE